MAFNSSQYQHGFIPYGSDDPNVIEYATLLDADNIGSAVVTGTLDYNANGVQVGATQDGSDTLKWPIAVVTQMQNGGHFSFDLEKAIFEDGVSEALNSVLFSLSGTGSAHYRKNVSDKLFVLGNSGAGVQAAALNNTNMDDKVRCHVSFTNYGIDMYVDYQLVLSNAWNAMPDLSAGVLYLSGLGTAGTPNQTLSRYSNIQLSSRPITRPVYSRALNVTMLTDSQGKFGQYPLSNFPILGEQVEDYGDASIKANDTYKNRGMIPVIHGELAKNGIYIGEKIHWHGRGGAALLGANPLSVRTDSMLAGEGGTDYPTPGQRNNAQIIVCNVGTNDIAVGANQVNALAAYKTEIDEWDAVADHIFICTVPDRFAPADYSDASGLADIASLNVLYKTLPAYNSKVVIVDLNPLILSSDVNPDGIHLNVSGQSKVGKAIAQSIRDTI